jgi:hypothetical protein
MMRISSRYSQVYPIFGYLSGILALHNELSEPEKAGREAFDGRIEESLRAFFFCGKGVKWQK